MGKDRQLVKLGDSGRWEKLIGTIMNLVVGVDGRITSPRKNDPMDSVQVGKAVFVKEKLHNPGNRTQDLLLSGENWLP